MQFRQDLGVLIQQSKCTRQSSVAKCGIAADQIAKIPFHAETRSKLLLGGSGFLYRGVIQFSQIHWAAVEALDYLLAKGSAAGPVRGGS